MSSLSIFLTTLLIATLNFPLVVSAQQAETMHPSASEKHISSVEKETEQPNEEKKSDQQTSLKHPPKTQKDEFRQLEQASASQGIDKLWLIVALGIGAWLGAYFSINRQLKQNQIKVTTDLLTPLKNDYQQLSAKLEDVTQALSSINQRLDTSNDEQANEKTLINTLSKEQEQSYHKLNAEQEIDSIIHTPALPHYFNTPFPVKMHHQLPVDEVDAITGRTVAGYYDSKFGALCKSLNSEQIQEREAALKHQAVAFLKHRGEPTGTPLNESLLLKARENETFWFLGDIHGSWSALLKAYSFILKQSREIGGFHTLIFLGDILDRGKESFNTLACVQYMLEEHGDENSPLKVIYIRGNHDTALSLLPKSDEETTHRFTSNVLPAESVDDLNHLYSNNSELALILGKAAIRLAETSPCMGEIMGLDAQHPERTLLFTHGGVPHMDLQESLANLAITDNTKREFYLKPFMETVPEELKPQLAKDFTWIRMIAKGKRKFVDRFSSGCEIGPLDVNDFRIQHRERTGRIITFIIRGHDHEQAGYKLYSYDKDFLPPDTSANRMQTDCGVLTINTMEPDLSSSGLYMARDLAIASIHHSPTPIVEINLLKTHHLM